MIYPQVCVDLVGNPSHGMDSTGLLGAAAGLLVWYGVLAAILHNTTQERSSTTLIT